VVTLAAKSCGATTQLSIGKDIGIMRRVTLPPTVVDVATPWHGLATTTQHLVEGPISLEVALRRLPSVSSLTTILRVTETQSVYTIAPPIVFAYDPTSRVLSSLRFR